MRWMAVAWGVDNDCRAKLKLALVVVTIVNVDGGIYRVIRGHFGSRVTPENFNPPTHSLGCLCPLEFSGTKS